MKKLSLLFLILFFASCAQERTTSRDVKKKMDAAGMTVTNVQGLYWKDSTSNGDPSDLFCEDYNSFYDETGVDLMSLQSYWPDFGCFGSMYEVIVAVEMNQTNTGGTFFLIIFPNNLSDINSGDLSYETNFIAEGDSHLYHKWGFGVGFTIYNQAGSTTTGYNAFQSFQGTLDDGLGVVNMYTQDGGYNYELSVSFAGYTLIDGLPVQHTY